MNEEKMDIASKKCFDALQGLTNEEVKITTFSFLGALAVSMGVDEEVAKPYLGLMMHSFEIFVNAEAKDVD